ncbi:MAG: glycosyltransferase family 39 protein [Thermoanaerobaculia bacterium]
MTETGLSSFAVRHRTLLLLVLCTVVYIAPLGLRDMWYPDEPDIAEVAQSMYVSGDWVAPRRMGVIWVDYPPMIYWVGSISSHLLGGMTEFALRLPIALSAILLVLVTCGVVSRWFDPRTGLWSGFVLATFTEFVFEAICYRTDMLFASFIGIGVLVYAAGAGERPRWLLRVAGFALLGLAVLSKGPLGLLLPGLVLTLWHGARREWRRLLELAPLALVSIAVALPWYVACARAMGVETFLGEILAQNFERFQSGFRGHGQPLYYYLTEIWFDLIPWALLLPFAIWWVVRSGLWRNRYLQLALWWFGAFFVFLTLAETKRLVYMLPAYPAAALLLGRYFTAIGETESAHPRPDLLPVRALTALAAILFLVGGVALVVGAVATETIAERAELDALETQVALGVRWALALVGATTIAAAMWMGQAWRRGDLHTVLVRIGVSVMVIYLGATMFLFPPFDVTKSYKPQSRWIRQQIGDEDHFGLVNPEYGFRKMGAFGFYSGVLVDLLESRGEIESFFERHPGSVVLVLEEVADDMFAGAEEEWRGRVVRPLQVSSFHYLVLRGP